MKKTPSGPWKRVGENLVRYVSSRTIYAVFRVPGKKSSVRVSLDTKDLQTAKGCLRPSARKSWGPRRLYRRRQAKKLLRCIKARWDRGGTLRINGNQSAATGAVSVTGTGTLGGTGIVGGAVTVGSGAHLAPGSGSTGNLTVASLDLAAGSFTDFEINGSGLGSFDTLTSSGLMDLGGTFTLTFGSMLAGGDSLDLFLGTLLSNFDDVLLTGGGYTAGSFAQSGSLWTSIQGLQTPHLRLHHRRPFRGRHSGAQHLHSCLGRGGRVHPRRALAQAGPRAYRLIILR